MKLCRSGSCAHKKTMSKKVLILGATWRTGKHAIPFALAKGYQVVALVRNPAKISVKSDGLTKIFGKVDN